MGVRVEAFYDEVDMEAFSAQFDCLALTHPRCIPYTLLHDLCSGRG